MQLRKGTRGPTCDAVCLGDEGEAPGGSVALVDPLEEALDLLQRVPDGVLADVELGGLGAVDLEHPEPALLPRAPDHIEPLRSSKQPGRMSDSTRMEVGNQEAGGVVRCSPRASRRGGTSPGSPPATGRPLPPPSREMPPRPARPRLPLSLAGWDLPSTARATRNGSSRAPEPPTDKETRGKAEKAHMSDVGPRSMLHATRNPTQVAYITEYVTVSLRNEDNWPEWILLKWAELGRDSHSILWTFTQTQSCPPSILHTSDTTRRS